MCVESMSAALASSQIILRWGYCVPFGAVPIISPHKERHMTTTDLGNDVRAEIAKILRRFEGCDLAGVKVSTLKRIDAYLNPPADTFSIPVERCDARPYLAMELAAVERMQERA